MTVSFSHCSQLPDRKRNLSRRIWIPEKPRHWSRGTSCPRILPIHRPRWRCLPSGILRRRWKRFRRQGSTFAHTTTTPRSVGPCQRTCLQERRRRCRSIRREGFPDQHRQTVLDDKYYEEINESNNCRTLICAIIK